MLYKLKWFMVTVIGIILLALSLLTGLTCLYKQSRFVHKEVAYINEVIQIDGKYNPTYTFYDEDTKIEYNQNKLYKNREDIPNSIILYYNLVFGKFMMYGNNSSLFLASIFVFFLSTFMISYSTVEMGWYYDGSLE